MNEPFVLFLLGQSVIIVGAILAAYIATRVRIAKISENVKSLTDNQTITAKNVKKIEENLADLGREVSELFGIIRFRGGADEQ